MLSRILSYFTGDEPIRPATISADAFFQRLAAAGLDWRRSSDDLFDEYGARPLSEHSQAIYLPETTALTSFPIRFHVRIPGALDHRPPSQYVADVNVLGDPMRNFNAVRAELAPLLGSGRDDATSNTIGRKWDLGEFRVTLVAFPRRLNRQGARPDASLTVSSSIPHEPPDESLHAIAALGDASRRLQVESVPPGWHWFLTRQNFATVRNPAGVFDDVAEAAPLLWRDDAAARLGLSARDVSFAFPRGGVIGLGIRDEPPDRSPWCARGIDLLLHRRRGGVTRVPLGDASCHMNDWSKADPAPLARHLADFWRVPFE